MDWSDLQYFLAVAHGGSISRASRTLRVNHSTVLRRLQRLEERLGVALFQRLPGGYELTAAGEALGSQLAGVGEQIERAERQLLGQDLQIRGSIRLTSTDTLFAGLLTPLLAEFREQHPGVQLQLVINNSFLRLTQREADMAVRGTNRPPENLLGRCVGRIQAALYASSAYLAGRPASLPLSEHLWVAPDESLAHLEQAAWLAARVADEQVVARSDSLVGMVDCVRLGMGVGLLLCPLAEAHGELVRLAEPDPALDTQVWVLTHPDLRRVARIRALGEFLYQRLSADPRLMH
ncbi:LysR family transcriptional regulator [Pseudomonas benzenivorans]|uniref:LysR family transcriptional regulator n=1 Tax=Pseudomonas benzenivorans TaxID=556533 RepID=A0ABY5H5R1_9PSED|nr:LysR family transcriptional regulator [Pseudomonas benzenivorans]UTW06650.1 LysR family transcriptional regulator [Pseudomonas benzenivorans]